MDQEVPAPKPGVVRYATLRATAYRRPGGDPVAVQMVFIEDDPYAVTLVFGVGTDDPKRWIIARQLLAEAWSGRARSVQGGLFEATRTGSSIIVGLRSTHADTEPQEFRFSVEEVQNFLSMTVALVRFNEEGASINWTEEETFVGVETGAFTTPSASNR